MIFGKNIGCRKYEEYIFNELIGMKTYELSICHLK